MWLFNISEDMDPQTAFVSLEGETLVVPQTGALEVTTELGKLMVRANEIAVIPRGMRHHVKVVEGGICRGYICELQKDTIASQS